MQRPNGQFKLTRIAPTPSGFLHLGNAWSFALTAAIARSMGAETLLRIDDMDRERVNAAYIADIFDTLNFLEIPWNFGPHDPDEFTSKWSQVHRMDIYKPALDQLAEIKAVFTCTCSRKQLQLPSYTCNCMAKNLPLDTPDAAWRIKTDERWLAVNTLSGEVIKRQLPQSIKNFVVRKKDGYPAYQLTSLLDDVHFGVDMIIRGEDLWPSTIAQLYLASVLGLTIFGNTTFHHHKLLTLANGEKLSKSAGSTAIQHLRKQGSKLPEVYNEISRKLGLAKNIDHWREISNN